MYFLCGAVDDVKTGELLEEKGADFVARDIKGQTAVEIAEYNQQEEMTNFLRAHASKESVEVRRAN